ncbi:PREDICTED: putative pectinesterase/pectinesterase inhibitor 22 [Camelina sativa]|uniref:Pectinesterase n=1 Tax=Camelina sativa TaxID=90675 RepID=A0ABM0TQT7_CAMSA|nr:PREDICTED: putative pectinesterase/pectinesterase inhibitor 22 [Camelina sativa]
MGIMALLLVMLLFVHTSSSETTIFKPYKEENFQSLVAKACQFIDAHESCVSNIRTHIKESGHGLSPHSVLSAAVKEAHDKAKLAMEGIPTVTTLFVHSREQIAIEDCKELVGFSVTELAWSMLEMNKLHGGGGIDGDSHDAAAAEGNLKTWLSAAMSNQDTCLEGFEGTERKYEELIKGSLRQVTQLVSNVLDMYTQLNALPFKASRNESFPSRPEWLTETEESLMKRHEPSAMHSNTVVSLDGKGKYRTINEAINEAPNHSTKRYVIYVKKGVYKENIDLKKKKTNIMLVGDGIGQTIITGNRNFMQGLTTFRTATVDSNSLGRCL